VKAKLERFDCAALLRLLKDLHEVSRENQVFSTLALASARRVPSAPHHHHKIGGPAGSIE